MEEEPLYNALAPLKRRRASTDDESEDTKRKRTDFNIVDFSDCVLMLILKYLNTTHLFQLGRTCKRFHYLVQDELLWINVDATSPPNNFRKFDFCWNNVHEKTRRIHTHGTRRSQVAFSLDTLILSNKLSSLTVLALEHQTIKYCLLKDFPGTLQELSLRYSYIYRHKLFFQFAMDKMSNLRVLLMDNCGWLEGGILTSICKYPKLEIVSFYKCKKLGEDDISTISVSGSLGFKNLKVLDVRFTGYGNQVLRTFMKNPHLQALYFQCFPTTYRLERFQRQLDILDGAKFQPGALISDDEDNNDTSEESLIKRFGTCPTTSYSFDTVTERGTTVFQQYKPNKEREQRPRSLLYKYPYDEKCTCGFMDFNIGQSHPRVRAPSVPDVEQSERSSDESPEEGLINNNRHTEKYGWNRKHIRWSIKREERRRVQADHVRFLRPKWQGYHGLIYDCCLLANRYHVQSRPTYPHNKWLGAREPRNDHEISMLEHTDKHARDMSTAQDGAVYMMKAISCMNTTCSAPHLCRCERTQDLHPGDIWNVLSTVAKCLKRLNVAENDTDSVIEVLRAFDEQLNAMAWQTCTEDRWSANMCQEWANERPFMSVLTNLLVRLSREIRHDYKVVLNHHVLCFEKACRRMEQEKEPPEQQIAFLDLFKSMMCIESGECCCQKIHTTWNFRQEEDPWSQAGPSRFGSSESGSDNENDGDCIMVKIEMNRSQQQNAPIDVDRRMLGYRVEMVQLQPMLEFPTDIRELSLRGYRHITGRTLGWLQNLELDLLDVTGTRVLAEDVQQFLSYRPQCRVVHEAACTCRPALHF